MPQDSRSAQHTPTDFNLLPRASIEPDAIPADIIEECLETYCQAFSNQPCLLFSDIELQEWEPRRQLPGLVHYPMLALILRTSKHPWLGDNSRKQGIIDDMSHRAWELLTSTYASFHFDEAYYQGLCIMAQADFTGM